MTDRPNEPQSPATSDKSEPKPAAAAAGAADALGGLKKKGPKRAGGRPLTPVEPVPPSEAEHPTAGHPHPTAHPKHLDAVDAFMPYVPHALIVAGVALLAYIALQIGASMSRSYQATAWTQFVLASSKFEESLGSFARPTGELGPAADKLAEVAARFDSAPAGLWAKVDLADDKLKAGVEKLTTDRAKGVEEIGAAVKLYEEALKGAGSWGAQGELVRQRSTLGAGLAEESRGALEAAAKHYRTFVETWPGSPLAVRAKLRLNALQGDRLAMTEQFYKDFAAYKPFMPPPAGGTHGIPGMTPGLKPDFSTQVNPTAFPPLSGTPATTGTASEGSSSPSATPATTTAAPVATGDGPKLDGTPAPKSGTEAPKAETPKTEAPAAEAPKSETPKVEAPKTEAAKPEAPKTETPKAETPKSEAPKPEGAAASAGGPSLEGAAAPK